MAALPRTIIAPASEMADVLCPRPPAQARPPVVPVADPEPEVEQYTDRDRWEAEREAYDEAAAEVQAEIYEERIAEWMGER